MDARTIPHRDINRCISSTGGVKVPVLAMLMAVLSSILSISSMAQDSLPSMEQGLRNVYIEPQVGALTVRWSVNAEQVDGQLVVLRWSRLVHTRHGEGEWQYADPMDASPIQQYEIEGLKEDEGYVVELALIPGHLPSRASPEKVWEKNFSEAVSHERLEVKTRRGWGVVRALMLLGALALFIYGMKVMSEGLQQAAGKRLRGMLASMTSNRIKGVLTGLGITATIQSSSVTTVMTVSFVNAGLLTLVQSAGVMMGANVGTTVTAWLISAFGFTVDVASYSLVVLALAFPLMFFARSRGKSWAMAMIGFAILFMGLGLLKHQVPTLDEDSAIVRFFTEFPDIPVVSTLMFVLLGALVTVVIQSSSAAMALTMTLVQAGIIPFDVACAMVLGENIGTTITAELASTIANVHAKRSARIHSLFNIIGVSWMVVAFPLFVGLDVKVLEAFGVSDPRLESSTTSTGLALFHTLFNVTNVLIMIWFVPQLVSLAQRTVKSKGGEDESFGLKFLGRGVVTMPELALGEAKKEVGEFGRLVGRMNGFVKELLLTGDPRVRPRLVRRIQEYEEATDRYEYEIGDYLGKVAQKRMAAGTTNRVRGMNSVISDLEQIGDLYFQVSKLLEKITEQGPGLDPGQMQGLTKLLDALGQGARVMNTHLSEHNEQVVLQQADQVRERVDALVARLRREHLDAMLKQDHDRRTGQLYMDILSCADKIGEHMLHVSRAIVAHV